MKVVAIIQARMGSTRLPGKVMKEIELWPVLGWCVDAARYAPGVDEVWVATSTLEQDNVILEWCSSQDVPVWRGSETDVLDRFVGCAEASGADIILRLTGDCPFLDPQIIGAAVTLQKMTGADYVSNVSPRTYPDGLDVQVMTRRALLAAHAEATRPIDRDCVCTWIERNRSRFPAAALINPLPGMEKERWVLDTADDFRFSEAVARELANKGLGVSMLNILSILDANPEIRRINADGICNERFFDALREEPLYERSYQRSQETFARTKEIIPLAAQTFSKSYLQYPQPSPLFVSHGQGGLVWDVDGNEYVDLVSALLPNILGYRDADVDWAVRRQLDSGISFSLATELEAELAALLIRHIPCAEAVRFGKTGTDVTTAAVRLARAYTGRDKVLICGGYHGWADWSIDRDLGVPDAVKSRSSRIRFGDQNAATSAFGNQTVRMDYRQIQDGDLWAMEKRLKKDWYAAVIVEPEFDPDYLRHLRWLTEHYGALLIFDEIITGFRYDLGGAQKIYGVTPDLATFGKAMANGMPISAIVGRKDIMAKFAPPDNIFYSGTFFGETLSLAAAIATINKIERDGITDRLWRTGDELAGGIAALKLAHHIDTELTLYGAGPMKRIKFADDKIAALFRREMIATGTLIIASNNICAAHGAAEVARALKSYDHALGVIRDAIDKGDIDARLAGASIGPAVRQA